MIKIHQDRIFMDHHQALKPGHDDLTNNSSHLDIIRKKHSQSALAKLVSSSSPKRFKTTNVSASLCNSPQFFRNPSEANVSVIGESGREVHSLQSALNKMHILNEASASSLKHPNAKLPNLHKHRSLKEEITLQDQTISFNMNPMIHPSSSMGLLTANDEMKTPNIKESKTHQDVKTQSKSQLTLEGSSIDISTSPFEFPYVTMKNGMQLDKSFEKSQQEQQQVIEEKGPSATDSNVTNQELTGAPESAPLPETLLATTQPEILETAPSSNVEPPPLTSTYQEEPITAQETIRLEHLPIPQRQCEKPPQPAQTYVFPYEISNKKKSIDVVIPSLTYPQQDNKEAFERFYRSVSPNNNNKSHQAVPRPPKYDAHLQPLSAPVYDKNYHRMMETSSNVPSSPRYDLDGTYCRSSVSMSTEKKKQDSFKLPSIFKKESTSDVRKSDHLITLDIDASLFTNIDSKPPFVNTAIEKASTPLNANRDNSPTLAFTSLNKVIHAKVLGMQDQTSSNNGNPSLTLLTPNDIHLYK
ncbi:hypothetical protein C9374_006458 [Naegleria lovaniensis]|uniref:Uncharacterized protein n=1 Tax=Naegleria lovaniensis TaxID=51637 RepID=A0AA88KH75_NAELO|nr:uncharacterized protein C9374_006458 [Naegleria lovaniensis]KAG2381469.1 hypothetical protein C9374_006458 [Naegleria lovaniensis]